MLKRHNQLFLAALMGGDLLLTGLIWLAAFHLRYEVAAIRDLFVVTFHAKPLVPIFSDYLKALPVVLLVSAFCYQGVGLYLPRREGLLMAEVVDVCKGAGLCVLVLLAGSVFYRDFECSRSFMAFYLILVCAVLSVGHVVLRMLLRDLRQRGRNLRHVLIVGAGRLGQEVLDRIVTNPWMGLKPMGFVDDDPARRGQSIRDLPVLGTLSAVPSLIAEGQVDQVICALPMEEQSKLQVLLDALSQEVVDVRIVPDLFNYGSLNPSVGDLDGLPILSLREGPLHGWNKLMKRLTDIVFSLLVLVLGSPFLLLLGLLVKLTSTGGPVLFRQKRMSLDGKVFDMLKFRTMKVDAEKETGPVWAKENDDRRTPIGAFLRKTSMDELPQFWNVFRGDMSIVGPRPERPEFIESFRTTVPRYMLRHKIKAGITGWAQVNGWRGNTSLEKRIQYDLYYIENWSVWFDLRIMFLTVFRGLVNKHAY